MRRFSFAIVAALVAACTDSTGPSTSPRYLFLSGVWEASSSAPGGFLLRIATIARDGRIDGIGVAYLLQGIDSLKISGDYAADGSFGLSIAYASGQDAAFSGVVQRTDSLTGTWTDRGTGASHEVSFARLPVPPCSDSVPLTGTLDPAHPGFFVQLQDTVDAATEAARLGTLYGFTPTRVSAVQFRGFAAAIPMSTVTVLRCEPKVVEVMYDGGATIAG